LLARLKGGTSPFLKVAAPAKGLQVGHGGDTGFDDGDDMVAVQLGKVGQPWAILSEGMKAAGLAGEVIPDEGRSLVRRPRVEVSEEMDIAGALAPVFILLLVEFLEGAVFGGFAGEKRVAPEAMTWLNKAGSCCREFNFAGIEISYGH